MAEDVSAILTAIADLKAGFVGLRVEFGDLKNAVSRDVAGVRADIAGLREKSTGSPTCG